MYVCIYIYISLHTNNKYVCMYVFIYVYVNKHVYTLHMYKNNFFVIINFKSNINNIPLHTYTHTYTHHSVYSDTIHINT